ncbi:MAG: GNAT family N-acetyltransferase [Caldilineaceae bacterium]
MQIIPLQPAHAGDAARLHIAGQPGTFLTSLGPQLLTVFYDSLARSSTGFGFAAVDDAQVLGFVSAATSVGSLFIELGTRRMGGFLPPLLARFARQPSLMLRSLETLFYPMLAARQNPHGNHNHGPAAELLSIMVEPHLRSQGVGSQLMSALTAECTRRQIALLDVTVDKANAGARRFYTRHGFSLAREFALYGRTMYQYQLTLNIDERINSTS